ncbi:hypothetical protein Pmani_024159 [Petrolisthes manimaculis]|uniref:Uncharacterized protein n=1 Tax=Petrolisthes manimaculis TaxID=1843537 RepID=A0AAE1U2M8_9EUCA|nr:hypothetical protein Pmani_024159 [Petrolisthes manimaculis]
MHQGVENTAALSWHNSSSIIQNVNRPNQLNSGTGSWTRNANRGYSELSRGGGEGQCIGGILEDFRAVSNQEKEQHPWHVPVKEEPDGTFSSSSLPYSECYPSTHQEQQDCSHETNLYPSQVYNNPSRLSSTSSPLQDASSRASFSPQFPSKSSFSSELQKVANRRSSSSSTEHQEISSSTHGQFQQSSVVSPHSGSQQLVSDLLQHHNLSQQNNSQQQYHFHIQHNQNPQHQLLQKECSQQQQHLQQKQDPRHFQQQQRPKHPSKFSKIGLPPSPSVWQHVSGSKQPSKSSTLWQAPSSASASEEQVSTPQSQSPCVQSIPHHGQPQPHPSHVQPQLPHMQSHPCQVQPHHVQSLSHGQPQPPSSKPQTVVYPLRDPASPEVKILPNPQSSDLQVLFERPPPPGQPSKRQRVRQLLKEKCRLSQQSTPRKQQSSHVQFQLSKQLSSTNIIHSTPNQESTAVFHQSVQQETAINIHLPTVHKEPILSVQLTALQESSTTYSNTDISATTTSPCTTPSVTALVPSTTLINSATATTSAFTTTTNTLATSTSAFTITTNTSITSTSTSTTSTVPTSASTTITNTLEKKTPLIKDELNLTMPKLTRLSDDPTFLKKRFRRQLGKFARMLEGEEFPKLSSKPLSSCRRSSESTNKSLPPLATSSLPGSMSPSVNNSPSTVRVPPSTHSVAATSEPVYLSEKQATCDSPLDIHASLGTFNLPAHLPPPLSSVSFVNSSIHQNSSSSSCTLSPSLPTTHTVDASLSSSLSSAPATSSTLSTVCSSASLPLSSSPLCNTPSSSSTVTLSNNISKITLQETELDQSIALLEEFLDLSSLIDKCIDSSATPDGNSTIPAKLSAALYCKSLHDVTSKSPGDTGPTEVFTTTSIPTAVSVSAVDGGRTETISTIATQKTSPPLVSTTTICSTGVISHTSLHGVSPLLDASPSLQKTSSSIPNSSHFFPNTSLPVHKATLPFSHASNSSPTLITSFSTHSRSSLASQPHPSPTLPNSSPSLPHSFNTPVSSTPPLTIAYDSPVITHFPSPSHHSTSLHQPTSLPRIIPSPSVSCTVVASHPISSHLSSNIPSPSLPTQFPSPTLPVINPSNLSPKEASKPEDSEKKRFDFSVSNNKTDLSHVNSDPNVRSHERVAKGDASDTLESIANILKVTSEPNANKNELTSQRTNHSVSVKDPVAKERKSLQRTMVDSLPPLRPKGMFSYIQCMQARFSAYLEPSLELPCLQCRQVVPGSDALHHLFFSQIECATCHVSINTCAEFRTLKALGTSCKAVKVPRKRGRPPTFERCEETRKQVAEAGGSHVIRAKKDLCTEKEARERNLGGIKFKIHYGGRGKGEGRTSIQVGENSDKRSEVIGETQRVVMSRDTRTEVDWNCRQGRVGSQTQNLSENNYSGDHTCLRWAQDPVGVVYYHMRRKLATKHFYAGKDRHQTTEDVVEEMVKFVTKFAPLKYYSPWSDAIQKCWKYIYSMQCTGDVSKGIRENKRKRSTKDEQDMTNTVIQERIERGVEEKQKVLGKEEERERGTEKKMKTSLEFEGKEQVGVDATKDDGIVNNNKNDTGKRKRKNKTAKNVEGGMTLRKRKEEITEHKRNEENPAKRRRKERNREGAVSPSNIRKVRLRKRGRGAPRKRSFGGSGRRGRKRGRWWRRRRVIEDNNTHIELKEDVCNVGVDREVMKSTLEDEKRTKISETDEKQAGNNKEVTSKNMSDELSKIGEEVLEHPIVKDNLKEVENPVKITNKSIEEDKEEKKEVKMNYVDKRACIEQDDTRHSTAGIMVEEMEKNVMKEEANPMMEGLFTRLLHQNQLQKDGTGKNWDEKIDKKGDVMIIKQAGYLDTMQEEEEIMEKEVVKCQVERFFNKVEDTLLKHYYRRLSLSPTVTDEDKTVMEKREEEESATTNNVWEENSVEKNKQKQIRGTVEDAIVGINKMDNKEMNKGFNNITEEGKTEDEEISEEDSEYMEVKEEEVEEEVMRGKGKLLLKADGNGTPADCMMKVEESKEKKMKAKMEAEVVTERGEEDFEEYGDPLLTQSYSSDNLESIVQYVSLVD